MLKYAAAAMLVATIAGACGPPQGPESPTERAIRAYKEAPWGIPSSGSQDIDPMATQEAAILLYRSAPWSPGGLNTSNSN